MKKILTVLLLMAFCSVFAQKYLYTIELTPANLADIDPRQNVSLKDIGNKQKAIVVSKGDSAWLDITREVCLGKEIIASFKYKIAEPGKTVKNFRAVLRYALADVYCDGPEGKPVMLAADDKWRTGSCTIKFPAELEEAMIMFSCRDASIYVTDIKIYEKGKKK